GPLLRCELTPEHSRIGVIDIHARHAANGGICSGAKIRAERRDAEFDRITENDVARIIAVRSAVLEKKVGETVLEQLRQIGPDSCYPTEILDVRAGVERRDDNRFDQLRAGEPCVQRVARGERIASGSIAEEIRQAHAKVWDRRITGELVEEELPV